MTSPTDNPLRLSGDRWTTFLAHLFVVLAVWTLFTRFLADPDWSIWRSNWFVNKVFVLAAFVLLLGTVLFRPRLLVSSRSDAPSE